MYQLTMAVKDEHIDFQGIMDGLYYPFYMEECRHKYLKDILGIDIVAYAKNGLNLVLSEYNLKFKASIKKDDELIVSCELLISECSKIKFAFKQTITVLGKVMAEGVFWGTCVASSGGRPFIPEEILAYINRS
jgi:acyl-CoA thioester hydrolase